MNMGTLSGAQSTRYAVNCRAEGRRRSSYSGAVG